MYLTSGWRFRDGFEDCDLHLHGLGEAPRRSLGLFSVTPATTAMMPNPPIEWHLGESEGNEEQECGEYRLDCQREG